MTGFAFCGSFCNHKAALAELRHLSEDGVELLPIFSYSVRDTDTRFGKASELCREAEEICGRKGVYTIKDAEPLGPAKPLDSLIICPCTGNTLSKLANGITDTPVLMAAKAHLRRDGRVLLSLASNDAMSANLQNIGKMILRKNIYFVPLKQDDPKGKPHSLVSDFSLLLQAYSAMGRGEQLRPLFL